MTNLHNEFTKNTLLITNIDKDPRSQFTVWLDEYIKQSESKSVEMAISTISRDGFPSSRIVYLRQSDERGFVFFTNYNSNKGQELSANKKASMLIYWPEFERQIRIWGIVEKVESEISDAYFKDRPKTSQAGAWISQQSEEIESREKLESMHQLFLRNVENKLIPRPEFWGGYRLLPQRYEFWQGRPSRLHDRFLYSLEGSEWKITRLAP